MLFSSAIDKSALVDNLTTGHFYIQQEKGYISFLIKVAQFYVRNFKHHKGFNPRKRGKKKAVWLAYSPKLMPPKKSCSCVLYKHGLNME